MKRRTTKFVVLFAVALSAIAAHPTFAVAEPNDSRPARSITEPNQPQPEDKLEGREVIVRLYDYWRYNPYTFGQAKMMLEQLEEFKKITIHLKKRLLIFDPNDPTIRGLGKSAAVVILPDDQTDALIKQSLGNKIGICPFQLHSDYLHTYRQVSQLHRGPSKTPSAIPSRVRLLLFS